LSTNGDTLRWRWFDHEIIDWLILNWRRYRLAFRPNVIQRLKSCWKAKIELSSSETEINFTIHATASGPKH
jgi:hypothetical protein